MRRAGNESGESSSSMAQRFGALGLARWACCGWRERDWTGVELVPQTCRMATELLIRPCLL